MSRSRRSTTTIAGSVTVDAIDAAASVRTPITHKLRFAAAARRSHLAWLANQVTDEDVGALFPIPSYLDGQVRLVFEPSTRARLEVAALGSADHVTRTVTSADPAMVRSDEQDAGFWRAWTRYHAQTDDLAEVDVVVWGGRDTASKTERFGANPTEVAARAGVGGVRAAWRRTSGRFTLGLGVDGEITSTHTERSGSITVPSREGDIRVFGQPPPDQLAADAWHAVSASAAPFATLDVSLFGDRLHLTPGLRVEPYFASVSRRTPIAGATPSVGLFGEETAVQPRLAIRLDVTSTLRLTAAAGKYRQAPQPADLSAAFGNPTLPTASARSPRRGRGCALRPRRCPRSSPAS